MTSISSPNALASFSSSYASSSKRPNVTLSPVQGREAGLAVAAVRGDGIWTYDISSLRATTSFTVPPTTVFATPPISFYPPPRISSSKSSGKQKADDSDYIDQDSAHGERITVVGILEGEKVKNDEKGRVVWIWKGEEGVKSTLTLDHAIHSIHHMPNHRAPILCVHTNGHLTALDLAQEVRPVRTTSTLGEVIVSKILSTIEDKVRIAILGKSGELIVLELDLGGGREITGEVVKKGKIVEKGDLAFGDISDEGHILATSANNRRMLISKSIKTLAEKTDSPPTMLNQPSAPPLTLPSLGRPVSLLAVSEPEPTLLLVSCTANITAVLDSCSLASLAPSAQATIENLSLASRSADNVYTVAISVKYHNDSSTRTAVHTVEIALPSNGVGMNLLLGTQSQTARFFKVQSASSSNSPFDKLTEKFASALKNGTGVQVLDEYIEAQKNPYTMPEQQVKAILTLVLDAALKKTEDGVKPTGSYSADVVGLLLGKEWVRDDMYQDGLLTALTELSDWTNASMAIRSIPTISSASSLAYVKKATAGIDAPPLATILNEILLSPVPAPDYRTALRSSLTVEDATELLKVYSQWLEEHVERRGEGLTGWTENKPPAPKEDKKKKRMSDGKQDFPALEAVIAYASALLDSHLPLFLSHPPSYEPLESLQASLTPLLALQESYRRLRAPVEAVLTLSRREARKREEREAKQNNTKGGAKGKNERKGEVGLPDEAVGKWRVEQFVF